MTESRTNIDFFISRAGADKAIAQEIGRILEAAGYSVILQDWDFGHADFLAKMDDALARSRRVVTLLSHSYLASEFCGVEWHAVFARDPRNYGQRLVLLRVTECEPTGILCVLAYTDLVPLRDKPGALRDVVLARLDPKRAPDATDAAAAYIRDARPVLHRDVAPIPNFTGRAREIAAIDRALGAGAAAAITQAAVAGLGGIGKSALAREYGWQRRDGHAGVWIVNAASASQIESSLIDLGAIFIRDLDKAQDRGEAARITLTRVLPSFAKPWLLVYDNLDSEKLLRDWAPKENAHVLVTTRVQSLSAALTRIELKRWPRADSVTYLEREANRADLTRTDLDALADDLGDLPLALSHAAAYLRDTIAVSVASYRERLAHHMANVPAGYEDQPSVFATYQTAIQAIEAKHPGAAAIMRLAAQLAPDDIPRELFTQAPEIYRDELVQLATDSPRLDETLSALHRLSLIRYAPGSRTFAVHRLVQAAVGAQGDHDEIATAVRTMAAVFPAVEFSNWAACARLIPHARHVIARIDDRDQLKFRRDGLVRLCAGAGNYLSGIAEFAAAEPLYRCALKIDEASLGPDHPEVASSLNNLAQLLSETNRLSEAELLYRRALTIAETSKGPDHPAVATILNNLAALLLRMNRLNEAEPMCRRALMIAEATLGPDHPDVASKLNNLAQLLSKTNRLSEAELLVRRALKIREASSVPDHPDVASGLSNLAALLEATSRLSEAEPLLRRALTIAEASLGPNHRDVAIKLHNLGMVLGQQGRLDECFNLQLRAARIMKASLPLDHPDVMLTTRGALHAALQAKRPMQEVGQLAAELEFDIRDVFRHMIDAVASSSGEQEHSRAESGASARGSASSKPGDWFRRLLGG